MGYIKSSNNSGNTSMFQGAMYYYKLTYREFEFLSGIQP